VEASSLGMKRPGRILSQIPPFSQQVKTGKPIGFSLPVSSYQRSVLIFIYMFLLPEGQKGEAWETSKKQISFQYLEILNSTIPSLF
jgi:hypothetical protein